LNLDLKPSEKISMDIRITQHHLKFIRNES
jgi:hypothetical protein